MLFCVAIVFSQSDIMLPDTSAQNMEKIMVLVRKNPPAQYRKVVMQRMNDRKKLQQRAYADILFDTVHHDGVAALISYVKVNLQMELSLEHGFLFWIIPPDPTFNTPGISFEEDLNFPKDPWEME